MTRAQWGEGSGTPAPPPGTTCGDPRCEVCHPELGRDRRGEEERRALEVLLAELNPEQRHHWETDRQIPVTDCQGGHWIVNGMGGKTTNVIYRHPGQGPIPVCFGPFTDATLPLPDFLLAQVLLITHEPRTAKELANLVPPTPVQRTVERVYQWWDPNR